MKYIKKTDQEQRILDLLRERKTIGAYVYEFTNSRPTGLGVEQYNARIWGLRDKGFKIKNTTPGHFVLEYDVELDSSNILHPSQPILEPLVQHDPENCQIDDHYHEYIKDNRKFWRHVEEARQLSL